MKERSQLVDLLNLDEKYIKRVMENLKKRKLQQKLKEGYLITLMDSYFGVFPLREFLKGLNSGAKYRNGPCPERKLFRFGRNSPNYDGIYAPQEEAIYLNLDEDIYRIKGGKASIIEKKNFGLETADRKMQFFIYNNELYGLSPDKKRFFKIRGDKITDKTQISTRPPWIICCITPRWITVGPKGNSYVLFTTEDKYFHIAPIDLETGEINYREIIYEGKCKTVSDKYFSQAEIVGEYLLTTGSNVKFEVIDMKTGGVKVITKAIQSRDRLGRFIVISLEQFSMGRGYLIFAGGSGPFRNLRVMKTTEDFIVTETTSFKFHSWKVQPLFFLTPDQYRNVVGE